MDTRRRPRRRRRRAGRERGVATFGTVYSLILDARMSRPAVLHILPALGGGVDRHVRDLAAAIDRPQLLWHVGERAEVMETAGEPRFMPLDAARVDADTTVLANWLRANDVGLTHLHGVGRGPRRRA